MIIEIFVDGSSSNNGKENCEAGFGVYFPNAENLNISKKIDETKHKVSNNVGEIMACIEGVKLINSSYESVSKILIYSDSEYTINAITLWAKSWKKKGWVKSDKKPIKNLELIKELFELYNNQNIEFIHVRSHQKEPENKKNSEYHKWYGNKMADILAKKSINAL